MAFEHLNFSLRTLSQANKRHRKHDRELVEALDYSSQILDWYIIWYF